jgi:Xaa-Pro aminopeptidase
MADLLLYGDTMRSPALRHEIPVAIMDPFLYAEVGGAAYVMTGHDELIAGDVVAIEPGLWDTAVGSLRYEDLVLVTEDGCETLTSYSYDLTP